MINTYRYGARGEKVEQDGKRAPVQIPSPIVLNRMGPFIEPVTITHRQISQELLEKQGKNVPTASVRALIDTGASLSVISQQVADELGFVQTGYQNISSVQDEQQQPVYYGRIIFPWGNGIEIPIVSCPLRRFDFLIGRDVLAHWHFTYNGVDGSIVICD
jgi:predicted aspartyl protease